MIRRVLVSSFAIASLTACGPNGTTPQTSHRPTVDPNKRALASGSPAEPLFPLVDGNVYSYRTEAADGARGVLIIRAKRADSTNGSLQMPGGVKTFTYRVDGVVITSAMATPMYVLKQPFTVGNRWRGEHRGWVEVTATDAAVKVLAGNYAGCLQTVEQRGGDRPLRIGTTFCPGVGIVLIEASSGTNSERIELLSYGAPVDLGPDGVKVQKGATPPDSSK